MPDRRSLLIWTSVGQSENSLYVTLLSLYRYQAFLNCAIVNRFVEYWARIGSEDNMTLCHRPTCRKEGVLLDYSTDGGVLTTAVCALHGVCFLYPRHQLKICVSIRCVLDPAARDGLSEVRVCEERLHRPPRGRSDQRDPSALVATVHHFFWTCHT